MASRPTIRAGQIWRLEPHPVSTAGTGSLGSAAAGCGCLVRGSFDTSLRIDASLESHQIIKLSRPAARPPG